MQEIVENSNNIMYNKSMRSIIIFTLTKKTIFVAYQLKHIKNVKYKKYEFQVNN